MIKKLVVWNNPYFDFEYHAKIDLIAGQAIYKTNTDNFGKPALPPQDKFYECFFLLPKERLNNFLPHLSVLETWKLKYEYKPKGIVLDGDFAWFVKIFNDNDEERIIRGNRCMPKDFDKFISEIEILLQKDFGQK